MYFILNMLKVVKSMIKNKKKTVIMIIISLLVAVFIELCIFQIYSLRGGNKDVNLEIYELKNIEKKGDYYVTTGEESSITIKYDGYINELAFDYISKNDFLWDVNVTDKDKNDKKISFMSAAIINVANKRVRFNSNKLTINIHANNVKFKNLRVHNKMDFNIKRRLLTKEEKLIREEINEDAEFSNLRLEGNKLVADTCDIVAEITYKEGKIIIKK